MSRDSEMISPADASFPYLEVFCDLREGCKLSWKFLKGHFNVNGPLSTGSYVER